MRFLTVYSSVTGNTRQVAEAMTRNVPGGELCAVGQAPEPDGYDVLLLGFWVRRGRPDDRMLRYMERVWRKKVILFGTLGAWPDSDHARACAAVATASMEERENSVQGVFLCQGKVNPKIIEAAPERVRLAHPMTEARRLRHLEAAKHPDAEDLARAGLFVRGCLDAFSL